MSILEEVKIIYEDEDVLVLDKPAGLSVHGDGKGSENTLVDWVLENRGEMRGVGEPLVLSDGREIERPGIVHRLDKETSGVILLAKTKESFGYFKNLFKKRKVKKEYHAFVYGLVAKEFGTIKAPIGRSKSDFRKRTIAKGARGELREAETYFEVLKRGDGATFLKVLPKTGRTHQIRVHLSSIQHPIVADSLYASKKPKLLGFDRLALHAKHLEVRLPGGKQGVFEAPYPEDFTRALEVF